MKLYNMEGSLKRFLTAYLVVVSIGMILGLLFLYHNTGYRPSDTVQIYGNDDNNIKDEFDISVNPSKTVGEMLMTTHNHILGFSFIILGVGLIFYFNSIITGFLKSFLLIEPLVSVVISFGSIWGIKLWNNNFVYLAVISALLMYGSIYFMIVVSLYELNKK